MVSVRVASPLAAELMLLDCLPNSAEFGSVKEHAEVEMETPARVVANLHI